MKKIYITLIILIIAMTGMAYLYFSRLNTASSYNDVGLHAATANSGLVFCIENDKSIFEILKGQDFFERLIGEEKFSQFKLLKDHIISQPALNSLIAHQNIFIGFTAGKKKDIDYLISTQLTNETDKQQLLNALKLKGIKIDTSGEVINLRLNDSTHFYVALEKNLLLLSNVPSTLKNAVSITTAKETNDFAAFVKLSSKQSKNSLGNLFVDFNRIPALLKAVLPANLNGALSVFRNQGAYAALNYNFSKERVYFNGNTKVNDGANYLSLFSGLEAQKNSIDNLLPEGTANFSLYAIPDYKSWKAGLDHWFVALKQSTAVKNIISATNKSYRLNVNEIFPEYFKNQLICFQLGTAENLAAINLSNGDKVKQLLIDVSEDYDQDIKRLKINGLLYCYFGEPLKRFGSPYYVIIDNYMVFANQPSTLKDFLNSYRGNHLLINTPDYINLYSQISTAANVTYYANHKNSTDLVRNAVYTNYYRHYLANKGLGKFSSLVYQLSGDKGNFQTNFLINSLSEIDHENTIPE